MATTAWRAPLCRRPDDHPEVEHNWDSLAKLGKTCSCYCHGERDVQDALMAMQSIVPVGLGNGRDANSLRSVETPDGNGSEGTPS